MRRLLALLALACLLSVPVSAGGTHEGGDEPVCPPAETCSATNSAATGDEDPSEFITVLIDGVLLIVNLIP